MKRQSLNTVEAAIRFLTKLDVEIIETDGGTILRGVDLDNYEFELTCDSDTEVIAYAQSLQRVYQKACDKLDSNALFEEDMRVDLEPLHTILDTCSPAEGCCSAGGSSAATRVPRVRKQKQEVKQ